MPFTAIRSRLLRINSQIKPNGQLYCTVTHISAPFFEGSGVGVGVGGGRVIIHLQHGLSLSLSGRENGAKKKI